MFWEKVERDAQAPDPVELEEFLTADQLPIEPRPEFEEQLLRDLLARYLS